MASDGSKIPDEFWIFVDQASFWTRDNLSLTGKFVSSGFGAAFPDEVPTGSVAQWAPGTQAVQSAEDLRGADLNGSVDYLQYAPNPAYFGRPTPYASGVTVTYRVEYDAEVARRIHAPLLPSRLCALRLR